MVGRRSVSLNYNPLCDNAVDSNGLESWINSSRERVVFCLTTSLTDKTTQSVAPGQTIKGTKGGDWLQDHETGYYLPFNDEQGSRNFKNERLVLMERATSGTEDLVRTTSRNSRRTISGSSAALRRTLSGDSVDNKRSTSDSNVFRRTLSGDSIKTRTSFHWVDDGGSSHRIAGDSDLLKEVTVRPEVWYCIKPSGVGYRTDKFLDAKSSQSQIVACGAKITAVRDEDWLKVIEVKNSVDLLSALEAVGRRSFKAQSTVEIVDTGFWVPYIEDGERVFKNEKLVLFEKAEAQGANPSKPADEGYCSVM
mmetsp:Transcript_71505/g.205123  ORF Transcript_71505/g.205123 Transcript_71505/m.205123 type:complete len:308 (+) Transcript_71505:70-993(+)